MDNPLENLSQSNLKHIRKHLPEFQRYDANLTLENIVQLGEEIASHPENLISNPGGRQVFEQDVVLGGQQVRVRCVLNPLGNLRSIHIRK
jgi:hypothetical protein